MPVSITRQDKGGKNEVWQLDIGAELVSLTSPVGRVLLQWPPLTVSQAVVFPSFSRSIKYTSFGTNEGVYQFSLDGASLKGLRGFANRGLAAGGPGAARSILIRAALTTAGGLALCVLGIVMFSITLREISTGESATGKPHPIGLISALVGFAILCRGLYGFYQYRQIKKLTPPDA